MSSEFNPDTKNVSGVQFSIASPEEIRGVSVVEITKTETYEKDTPVIKGLFDPRMGVTETGKVCSTCNQNNILCPGHFGHIELARPVYSYHFINTVVKVLKCVCFKCSKILIDKESDIMKTLVDKSNKVRWAQVYNLCSKIKLCGQATMDGCGARQPDNYKNDSVVGIKATWKGFEGSSEVKTQTFEAEFVKQIFERISNEDCNIIGFSENWCRPEWLICSVLPVPPPAVRPSVQQDNSQRMDDDLTHKLQEIIKYNNSLREKMEKNNKPEVIQNWTNMLQYHCATLINNELPQISQATHRSGRPLKAIVQRLKGKEGRIRNNLMGKRVDFSARSVITPDPQIELDQLGVPIRVAKNLTIPEKVNSFNKKRLEELVQNGPDKWPGAKNIQKKNNIKITIMDTNIDSIILEHGDIVNRHLLDNDYVLFNRQPSLHKMSMMAHRVKVMKGNTFRLNISVTPPYNADFDGDEMNMHVPQSIASISELINIASVRNQIISPRENKPIITIVQDTLLGINKLTKSETLHFKRGNKLTHANNTNIYDTSGDNSEKIVPSSLFTRKQMMNIVCDLSTFNGIPPESDYILNVNGSEQLYWTGKIIMSYILPKTINLETPNQSYDNVPVKEKNFVRIIGGMLQSGTLDKDIFTKTSKGLIHTINNDLGCDRAKDFIDDLQKIVTYFILLEGFSVGISDMIADKETNGKMNTIIHENKQQIEDIMQELHLDIFENLTGQTNKAHFEGKVNSLLNKTLNETGKIGLSTLDEKNRATNMINSGSKGKATNIAQMVACLGQQNVDGSRIPYGFNDRTLPHYHKFDDSAEARGFVENSFISGQTPQEFFFHAMGGREGLIDTAVKTSQTGYIQRKLIKALEDVKVHYDYSVRSSSGTILQFIYGDDGMDSIYVESQPLILTKLPLKKSGDQKQDLFDKFHFNKSTDWKTFLARKTLTKMKKDDKLYEKLEDNFKTILAHRDYLIFEVFGGNPENNINYPIHIQRIVTNICGNPLSNESRYSDLSPLDIIRQNNKLKKRLLITENYPSTKILHILIDIHLSPKILINEYSITKSLYDQITMLIERQFYKSKVVPGEMVGPIAAQSIGEPATQMTLNTFHYAGVSSKSNVTRGIPRLKELLHVSGNIKSPSVQVHLNQDYAQEKHKAQYIKNVLEYTLLKDIVTNCKIYYDPNNMNDISRVEQDRDMLSLYKEFEGVHDDTDDDAEEKDFLPWMIRFTFNKEEMMDKGLVMEDINLTFLQWAEKGGEIDRIKFIYSDDNSKELIGRLSISGISVEEDSNGITDQSDIISSLKDLSEELMNKCVIKGIPDITNIILTQISKTRYDENSEISEEKRWILETDGTNLLQVMINPYVDFRQTISNDIIEVYRLLGIEAVRTLLIEQLIGVFDEYINDRHVELLSEIMTCKGALVSIDRHGINRGDVGPLAKCSFEDTADQLIKSSIFGEKDKLQGVSSNIMMGQTIPCGTGMCEIILDEEKLIRELTSINEDDTIEIDEENIDVLLDDTEEDCKLEDFKFSFED